MDLPGGHLNLLSVYGSCWPSLCLVHGDTHLMTSSERLMDPKGLQDVLWRLQVNISAW